jgi:hypothetical protein
MLSHHNKRKYHRKHRRKNHMPNVTLDNLAAQVSATLGAEASAVTLINGFAARVQAAVDAAVRNGATEAELAPVQAEVDALTASSTALASAVAANPNA